MVSSLQQMKEKEYPVFVIARKSGHTAHWNSKWMSRTACSLKKEKTKEQNPFLEREKDTPFISALLFIVANERHFAKPSNKSWKIDRSESKDRESRGRNGKGLGVGERGDRGELESTFTPAISPLINCGENASSSCTVAKKFSRNLEILLNSSNSIESQ